MYVLEDHNLGRDLANEIKHVVFFKSSDSGFFCCCSHYVWGFLFATAYVVYFFVSFLVRQSSHLRRESFYIWLFYCF